MNTKLLIIGAGGHGRVIADIALKMKKWEYIAFLDDSENIKTSMGIEIIDKSTSVSKYIEDYDIFVGIGNNVVRKKVQEELEDLGAIIPVLIHPSAIIGEQVYLEAGTVVMAGAVINCCTKIGKGCIINTASTIDHDNKIDDYVHISPGAHLAGTVRVGSGTWLGIGSVVINNINIINECKIGAGAVVIKDITETGTYIGIPARRVTDGENLNISE
ncbi:MULTISPECIES: acetyltransferase [Bacillus]|uniref:acetyltransferase n=2 Tax=Bacillaceae TaxID=186817 RepID=UPI00027BFEED|nr:MULTISPECIES: acetyltransferase [Bacillus cereus group]EJV85866.1 sialic acid O-acetyltransferase NeuD family sugar O-acyltransferase [Bacillus cereus HuB1-1]KXX85132.1 acetyltransferase [Bacillus cereus]MDA1557182.1 acetyltransferase [Bacillus cereus]MDC7734982.1 acetyltransferase [Bacillus thuringiensis]MED4643786.1 acetyltransferase [Bacillus cereus]